VLDLNRRALGQLPGGEAAGDRHGRHPSVRGAGDARSGRGDRLGLVHRAPGTRRGEGRALTELTCVTHTLLERRPRQ
jgi:hypothetical protein